MAGDWIEDFLVYTEGSPTPDIYRLWSAITAVSGALERRVWTKTARSQLFPNLYTLLVGAPGTGKTIAVTPVEELWRAAKIFHVAPNNVTKAALLDALERSDRVKKTATVYEYHSLLIAADEFGVLVPAHDLEFLATMSKIFDCPRVFDEERRHNKKKTEIIRPHITMLAGAQPGFMASLLPEEAWSMGFTSRLIMVYSATTPYVDLFDAQESRESQFNSLVERMIAMSDQFGPMQWELGASDVLREWAKARCPPEPTHSKLIHYNQRRVLHTIKLAMIASASRGRDMMITRIDLTRARDWILEAEQLMPDVFREMVNRSDGQVIQELHYFMWQLSVSSKNKPIHESRLIHFLQTRIPSEKITRLLDVAERSNTIARLAGTKLYLPKARHEHGIE